MKFNSLFVFIMTCILFALFNSCSDGDKPVLNITFPAAFVVNGLGNSISVIDLNNETKVHDISLYAAEFPHHVYLNPDKSLLAVAITGADLSGGHGGHGGGGTGGYKVQIFNSVTGIIEKEIVLLKLPHNAVFSPNGMELWIPQSGDPSQVLIYSTSDWKKFKEITVGKLTSEVTFASDGSKVYAANTDDATVSIIDPSSKSVVTTLPVGITPVGAWPASNGKMYVDNETSQTISEIDVASNLITATINLGFKPGYAAYNDQYSELWVSDADNGKAIFFKLVGNVWIKNGEVATGADAHAIVFNSDGSKAYVTNQGANTISIIDLNTHFKIKDIPVGLKPNGIAIKL
ncbi:MAG: YncE family protein [Bacteroidota bacterium]|nr:YncE family protein [Bacteroidota bacterium]